MAGPVLLQIVLIFLNAVFASAEIAVISMNETKLKRMAENGNRRAARLASLTEQPAKFLATIQVAITLAGLLGSAFAAENFAGPLVAAMIRAGITVPEAVLKSVSVFLITLILAYFNLVFGELVPKRIAMKKSEALALGMSGMLYGVSRLFAPLVFLLTVSTNFILRLMGIDPNEKEDTVSEEEIRMLLAAGNEQGTIHPEENEIIQNVFEFDDITVGQLCTHRMDVDSLSLSDGPEEWDQVIHSTRHSCYPVFGEQDDDVAGVLDTKDYFRIRSSRRSKEFILEHAVDKPYFIPESMKANVLFQNMKQSRVYFAVVIDEYGGFTGIVTIHDLIESLVGNLYEMQEPETEEIKKCGDKEWCIRGGADMAQVSCELGISLPEDKYETFNGFVCGIIDRVPDNGESFACESHGLKILVHTVKNHRIGTATVTLAGTEADPD